MTDFHSKDIQYRGETNGVHGWLTPTGQPYYWHPDWLHVAEDEMGQHPAESLDVKHDEVPKKEHAFQALLKHLKLHR